jgi:hypothetical protein
LKTSLGSLGLALEVVTALVGTAFVARRGRECVDPLSCAPCDADVRS